MEKFENQNRTGQQQTPMTNQMLTPQEVSQLIKISVGTLENWRLAGKGPRFFKIGNGPRGLVRYRQQDVEDWMFEDAKSGDEK